RVIALAAALVVALALAACTGPYQDLPKAEGEALQSQLGGQVEGLLAGLAAGDYAGFSKDFGAEMKSGMTETSLAELRGMLETKVGAYQGYRFVKAQSAGEFTRMVYEAQFSGDDKVSVVVVHGQEGGAWKVTGLWFDSAKLRQK
ncbi:MAG: DUF3887 domain-containing protein, partial [Chloroflexi bacterium]|nr:DUF3887 domain-containing protein [Chloroflexota bacterium]